MLVINEEIGFEYIFRKFWVGKISYGAYRATCLNLRFLRLELSEGALVFYFCFRNNEQVACWWSIGQLCSCILFILGLQVGWKRMSNVFSLLIYTVLIYKLNVKLPPLDSDIMIRETFRNKSEWCSRSMLGLFSKPVQDFRSDDVRCILEIRLIFVIQVN